jgi:hypothetical protein
VAVLTVEYRELTTLPRVHGRGGHTGRLLAMRFNCTQRKSFIASRSLTWARSRPNKSFDRSHRLVHNIEPWWQTFFIWKGSLRHISAISTAPTCHPMSHGEWCRWIKLRLYRWMTIDIVMGDIGFENSNTTKGRARKTIVFNCSSFKPRAIQLKTISYPWVT